MVKKKVKKPNIKMKRPRRDKLQTIMPGVQYGKRYGTEKVPGGKSPASPTSTLQY